MRKTREQFKQKRIEQDEINKTEYENKLKELSQKFWKDIEQIKKVAQNYTIRELENAKKTDWWWMIKEISVSRAY